MRRAMLGLAAVAAAAVVSTVVAEPKPEDAVAYREGIMMAIGWNVGPMGAMVKGDIPFDAEQFAFHAQRVAVLAPMALEGFTPGSAEAKSEALPKLWENRDDFEQRMHKLEKSTAKLAEIAKTGDADAMKAQFVDTVDVCKGCHDEYRKEH